MQSAIAKLSTTQINLIILTKTIRAEVDRALCYKQYNPTRSDATPTSMLQPIPIGGNRDRIWECSTERRTSSSTPLCHPPTSTHASAFFQLWELREDFRIIFDRDPAARNPLEVLLCYPGFHALALHRVAHWLYKIELPILPRLLSHVSRFLTGIEIHPGATIGKGVFIDHGMGVVIGETAIVGDYCLIYQGATLGGTGKESGKRHPTLGEGVVVGAGAKVLGNLQIGDRVRIGAGSIVLRDVPEDCTVVGVPGRIISRTGHGCPLEHNKLPDPEANAMRTLIDRIEQLERQLQTLQGLN